MKLTKFKHSCFTLEKDGQIVVVDPGNWTSDFLVAGGVAAIVLTHEHADHFDPQLLGNILAEHPDTTVIAPAEMVKKIEAASVRTVAPGDELTIGPFKLRFFGGQHAMIHPSIAGVANLGVLVDESFYYPGDSFAEPDIPIQTLALPVTAPWLKISEPIDFMLKLQPELVFPVHDHIASVDGKALVDSILGGFAEKNNIRYERINGTVTIAP